ncbi:MAG: hypothetical protein ACI4OT_05300 [Bacilli bacterium]
MEFLDYNNNNLVQQENILKNDLKKYCNNDLDNKKCMEYFDKKEYEKLGIDEDTKNYFLIYSFIKNYYVSKIGNPTVNEARSNIAFYASLKNRNFSIIEEWIYTNPNINKFFVERYIANISNYKVNINTLDETRMILQNYHNYFISNHVKIEKTKLLAKKDENKK